MNPGGMMNKAANKAATTAGKVSNQAVSTASTASNQVVSSAGQQLSNAASSSMSSMGTPVNSGVIGAPSQAKNPTLSSEEMANQIPMQDMMPEGGNGTPDHSNPISPEGSSEAPHNNEGAHNNAQPQGQEEGPQVGEKVDNGKEINEKGEVEDTATKKTVKAVGRGVAAYFTGGQSLGMDQAVTNNEIGDKAIGVISDVVEKAPGVKEAAEALDELGVPDLANDVMDMAGDIKNGDIGSAIEHGEKALKSTEKTKKQINKKMIGIIIGAAGAFFAFLLVFLTIFGPVMGGVIFVTDKLQGLYVEIKENLSNVIPNIAYDVISAIDYEKMLNDTPDFNQLSDLRQKVIATALSLIGRPYEWGGKPSGPGIEGVPASGLDCSGFVKWVFWTALGTEPPFGYTGHFKDSLPELERIDASQLQPGDICLKRIGGSGDGNGGNHVAIYGGNGTWIHAAGESTGIVRNNYKKCTVFFRHTGLD